MIIYGPYVIIYGPYMIIYGPYMIMLVYPFRAPWFWVYQTHARERSHMMVMPMIVPIIVNMVMMMLMMIMMAMTMMMNDDDSDRDDVYLSIYRLSDLSIYLSMY